MAFLPQHACSALSEGQSACATALLLEGKHLTVGPLQGPARTCDVAPLPSQVSYSVVFSEENRNQLYHK